MKKLGFYIIFSLVSVAFGFMFFNKSEAALGLVFGGKVISNPQSTIPAATCAGISFSILPVRGVPGPYYITNPTKGIPRSGGHVLGFYTTSSGPCCIPNPSGCTPVPTFIVTLYGASK
jgi:hypothetical protein